MAQPSKGLPPPSDDDPASQQLANGDADPSKVAVAISESDTSEGGKLKMIVQLVKRCLGVKDIAAMYVGCRPSRSQMTDVPNLILDTKQATVAARLVARTNAEPGVLALSRQA